MRVRLSREQRVEHNRGLVLDAARQVFLAKGYAGASVDAIAEEAGFSKGVVYSQFESKADLFLALLERRIDERAAENERVAAALAGPEALVALLRTAERDARHETGWARLLVEFRALALRDPDVNRRYAEAHARTIARLAGVVERVHVEAGVPPAAPFTTIAQLILALGTGIVLERAADADALPSDVVLAMLTRALGITDTTGQAGRDGRAHTGGASS